MGELQVRVKYNKAPETEQVRLFSQSVLALLYSTLASCPLVSGQSLRYSRPLHSEDTVIILRPEAKWGKNFQLEVRVTSKSSEYESEVAALTSIPPHHTASTALEIWRRQAGLVLPPGLLPVLLLHCQTIGLTNISMKSWQIVKKLFGYLASADLTDRSLILGLSDPVPARPSLLSPLLSRDGETQLFPGLTYSQWRSLSLLANKSLHQGVEAALLKTCRPDALYDRVYEVRGDTEVRTLVDHLARGLGDRVSMLALVGGQRAWSPGDGLQGLTVELGVRFDSECYKKLSTLGPLANCDTAKDFRQFWGERSELRRFHDGVVREVVVWGEDNVVTEVVTAVIARHHKDCSLEERGRGAETLLTGDGGREGRAVLDKLIPVLYGLQDLPLKIAGVAATGEHGRSSLVTDTDLLEVGGKAVKEEHSVAKLTSKTGMAPRSVQPLEVLLVAEQSGKWPREGEARRRVRVAWLQELGRRLVRSEVKCVARMMGERLVVMVSGQVLSFTLNTARSPECEVTSWLSSVDKSFPAWSGTVRLVKRWLASHLLSCIPVLAVEVSVAVVLTASPLPPTSPAAGLMSWLQVMASHDWNTHPLTHPDLRDKAEACDRAQLPPMAVLCPHSPKASHWTREVTWPQLQRLVSLANTCLSSEIAQSPHKLFTPNMDCYEVLIHLKHLQIPNRHLQLSNLIEGSENYSTKKTDTTIKTLPILNHDCLSKYISLLSSSYGNIAKFYHDKYGGSVIGVKIIDFKRDGKLKLGGIQGKMLVQSRAVTNWGAVMEDWSILGAGLVENVEILNTDIIL